MSITGESIRLSRLFSEDKNAVVVAVDHGLYFGPLAGMIDLPSVIDKVYGADAILMAPGMPAHCQSVFSKRGAPACIIRLNWGSNYAAMWKYKHSHSVPMLSVGDAVAQGAGAAALGQPEIVTIDGRPAFRLYVSSPKQDGDQVKSELVMIFEGRTSVLVKCQYGPDQQAPVEQACAHVTSTFHVSNPDSVGSPSPQAT